MNLNDAASKFKEDPNALVRVKAINSRLVFITGMVAKPASYSMQGGTVDVLQLISMAGGLLDFAKGDKIRIMRRDAKGQPVSFRFNYKEASKGNLKSLKDNIQLQPGDTVVVP